MKKVFPDDYFSSLSPGNVVAFCSTAPFTSLAQFEDFGERGDGPRIVSLRPPRQPHQVLLKSCVDGLALAAVAIWPDWYGADFGHAKKFESAEGMSITWRDKALALASLGKPPLPSGFPRAFHVKQLGLALGGARLIIGIASWDSMEEGELKSLVAGASWLAEQSDARVALFVNPHIFNSEACDKVFKQVIDLKVEIDVEVPKGEDVPAVRVSSVKGKPNSTSPGEMKMAERLGKDKELSGLFHFNQLVKSVHSKEYHVDLIWPHGRLVVEIDGYSFHSSPHAFAQDRNRDYELLISGYRVLRIPHDEIIKDIDKSVAKIRDSVNYLKKTLPYGS